MLEDRLLSLAANRRNNSKGRLSRYLIRQGMNRASDQYEHGGHAETDPELQNLI
jgi:hypothetical protein